MEPYLILDLPQLKRDIVEKRVHNILVAFDQFFDYSPKDQHLIGLMAEFLLFLFTQALRRRDWGQFADFEKFLETVEVRSFPVFTPDLKAFSVLTSKFDHYSDEATANTGHSIRSSYYHSMETRVARSKMPAIFAMFTDCFLYSKYGSVQQKTELTDQRMALIVRSMKQGHQDSYAWEYHYQKLRELPQSTLCSTVGFSTSNYKSYRFQLLLELDLPITLSTYSSYPELGPHLIGEYQGMRYHNCRDQEHIDQIRAKSYQILENRLTGNKEVIRLHPGVPGDMFKTAADWYYYTTKLQNGEPTWRDSWCYHDFVLGTQFVSIDELLTQLAHYSWVKDDALIRDPQVINWILTERVFLKRYVALVTRKSEDLIYSLVLGFCRYEDNWVHLPYFFPKLITELTPARQELYWIYQARTVMEQLPSSKNHELAMSALTIVQQQGQLKLSQ